MFRDSFADSLIPFFSTEYGTAYYSKGEPNALESFVEQYVPTAVVIEKVERNICDYSKNLAILTPPVAELPNKLTVERSDTCVAVEDCLYDVNYGAISGQLDAAFVEVDAEIVVLVNGVAYQAWMTGEDEFLLHVKKDALAGGAGADGSGVAGAAGGENVPAGTEVHVFTLQDGKFTQVLMERLA